jgi:hypothetical protein
MRLAKAAIMAASQVATKMHNRAVKTMYAIIERFPITANFPELDMIFYFLGYRGWILSKLASYAFK